MAEQGGESTQALKSWWTNFKKTKKKPAPPPPERLVFGVPLKESIKYANVAISLMNEQGESFIYGYVPIVVAKCGVFLKEKATDVEGIFRLSGSAKRINELKQVFDSPPKYGKGLDWTGYTVHDAANVFRRYLNMLPQPIVPLEFYEKFRDPLRGLQTQPLGDTAAQSQGMADLDHDKAIATYQKLITEIPDLNRQLLLYVLDLLSVFASKADVNRMTSANLSAIFQPGMLSHPDHNLSPPEYRLSQDVILFLIDNQDSFLIGMSGTAADEKTVRDLQNSGAQPATPSKAGLGRSLSNASAGADSARKLGVRRNISVSSKNSKQSSNAHTPNTPQSGAFSGSGVYRSNTVPSKRSPALPSTVGVRGIDSPTASVALSPGLAPLTARHSPTLQPATGTTPTIVPATPIAEKPIDAKEKLHVKEAEDINEQIDSHLTVETPPNKRRTSGLLVKNASSDSKDRGTPNKLKKRRAPTETSYSANSSSHSLSNIDYINSLPTPTTTFDNGTIPTNPPRIGDGVEEFVGPSVLRAAQQPSDQTLRGKSPVGSVHSKSSVTDLSEADNPAVKGEKEEKKRRWRFSSAARKHHGSVSEASPHRLGGNVNAGKSQGSMTSANKSRPSLQYDGVPPSFPLEAVSSEITQPSTTSDNSGSKDRDKDGAEDGEQKKGGLFGRIKARVEKSREERKEKEAEKERAKSPPRPEHNAERSGSKHSLSAIAHDILPSRNRSIDAGAPQQYTLAQHPVGQPAPDQATAERVMPKEQNSETIAAAPLPIYSAPAPVDNASASVDKAQATPIADSEAAVKPGVQNATITEHQAPTLESTKPAVLEAQQSDSAQTPTPEMVGTSAPHADRILEDSVASEPSTKATELGPTPGASGTDHHPVEETSLNGIEASMKPPALSEATSEHGIANTATETVPGDKTPTPINNASMPPDSTQEPPSAGVLNAVEETKADADTASVEAAQGLRMAEKTVEPESTWEKEIVEQKDNVPTTAVPGR